MARSSSPQGAAGFTLTEILIAVAIVAVLTAAAIPAFKKQRDKTKTMQAVADVSGVSVKITNFRLDSNRFPEDLLEIGFDKLDPWGRPYEYLNYETMKGNGKARKDKKLKPLNSDFDLYSVGPDGLSQAPLNAKASRDDIVRARDGKFVGIAEDFDP